MSKEQEEVSSTMSKEEQREIEREARLADNKRVAEARGLPIKIPRDRGSPMMQPGRLQSPVSSAGTSWESLVGLKVEDSSDEEQQEEMPVDEESSSESSLVSDESTGPLNDSDKAKATCAKTDKDKDKAKETEKQVSHSENTPSQQLPPVSQPVHPTQPQNTQSK